MDGYIVYFAHSDVRTSCYESVMQESTTVETWCGPVWPYGHTLGNLQKMKNGPRNTCGGILIGRFLAALSCPSAPNARARARERETAAHKHTRTGVVARHRLILCRVLSLSLYNATCEDAQRRKKHQPLHSLVYEHVLLVGPMTADGAGGGRGSKCWSRKIECKPGTAGRVSIVRG